MPYGYITTSNEWKKQLKNFNRGYNGRKTWDELYGTIDTAAQKGNSIVTQDYTDAISQAYGSAFGQKAAIANSNLFTGYKDAAIADIDYGLAEAYDTYRQNYLTQKARVDENATLAREQISTALGTEAENFKAYQDSYYGYLTDLYNRAYGLNDYEDIGADETLKTIFTTHPLWNRYLVDSGQEGVDPALISSSDLYAKLFDTKTGTINAQGTDFYRQMMYQLGPELGKYGFSEYLSKVNPKLYEWSMTQNPYNYTEGGTNAATFRQSVGLDSKDAPYDITSGYKALSDKQYYDVTRNTARGAVDNTIKSVSSVINDDVYATNADKLLEKHATAVFDKGDEAFKKLESYAKQVGVYDELDWDKYESELTSAKDKVFLEDVPEDVIKPDKSLTWEENAKRTRELITSWATTHDVLDEVDWDAVNKVISEVKNKTTGQISYDGYSIKLYNALSNITSKYANKAENSKRLKQYASIYEQILSDIDNSLGHSK